MDFDLSEEQQLLKDSAQRFVAERCAFADWQRWRQAGRWPGEVLWPQFAQMGWLALSLSVADGGFDAGPIETGLLMEALGRGLVAEPYLQTAVLAVELLKRSPAGPVRSARLAEIAAGRCRVALAHAEAGSRYALAQVSCQAARVPGGWRLDGRKTVVRDGDTADALIVSARSEAGITLFWLPAEVNGLARQPYSLLDGHHGANITLQAVPLPDSARLCDEGAGLAPLQAAHACALAAMGAEAVGLMDLLLAQTITYTSARRQFGQPLARFQALRHCLVDMFMQVEATRSLKLLVALRLAEGGAGIDAETARTLSALKVQIGKAGRFVGQQAVQLHGGMGMTDEIVVGHALKRLMALDAELGNADHHLQLFAAASR